VAPCGSPTATRSWSRLSHRAGLRNDLGRDECRMWADQHHPDGKFVPTPPNRGRSRPTVSCTRSGSGKRPLPRRHPGRRASQVQHRPDHGPATRSSMADVLRAGALVEVLDPYTVQNPTEASLRVHDATCWPRTGWGSSSTRPPQRRSTRSRTGRPESRRRSWDAGLSSSSSGVKGAIWSWTVFDKYFEPGLPYVDRVIIRVIKDPVTQDGRVQGQRDRLHRRLLGRSRRHPPRAEPTRQIMTGKETTPMMAMMKVTVPADGKPMSKDRAPHPIFNDLRVPQSHRVLRDRPQGDRENRLQGTGHAVARDHPPGTLDATDVTTCAPTTRSARKRCWLRPATARRSR